MEDTNGLNGIDPNDNPNNYILTSVMGPTGCFNGSVYFGLAII